MRISSIEIFEFVSRTATLPWHPVIVRVRTDEGISGIGEAGIAYGSGQSGAAGVIANLAKDVLLGKDPLETELRWDEMHGNTFWGHSPGPIFYGAISAIDIALWDIKGKSYSLPIHRLLGGPCRTSVEAYASQVQFGWSSGKELSLHKPKDYARVTEAMASDGYSCVKVNPIRYDASGDFIPSISGTVPRSLLRTIRDRVAAVRDAGGEDMGILVEFNSRCQTDAAAQIAHALEELDVLYLEEPVPFLCPTQFRDIKERTRIPVAGGERLYTRWQFLPYLKDRLIALAQPDVALAGGITEVKKICDLAQVFDIPTQPHVCGGPISVAASLHMCAATPNNRFQEHHVRSLRAETRGLVKEDYQPSGGRFALPDAPGLGLELNEKALSRAHAKVRIQ